MGWICYNLGYGHWAIVDGDNPENPPTVNIQGTITANPQLVSTFGRIANNQFNENEEVRYFTKSDRSYSLIGVALLGSDVNAPVWSIIQEFLSNGQATRDIFLSNVAWSTYAQG